MENIFIQIFSVSLRKIFHSGYFPINQMELRDQVIATSLRQFLKYGIKKVTVGKLIEPMGISTKTVYKHFGNKEDLLKHCLLLHYSELAKRYNNIGIENKNPVAAICELWHNAINLDFGVNHLFYHDLNYYYPQLQDAVLRKFFKKNFSEVHHIVVSGIEQGYFRDDIVAEIIPEVIGVLYSSITRTGQFKKFKLSATDLMHNTIDAYLRGICTEKGLKEIKKITKS